MARVLVVDDEQEILNICSLILKHAGYEVVTAASGDEALRVLQKTQVQLIIADIMMPDMNGFDLVRRIRERDFRLPILMCSSLTQTPQLLEAIQEGASGYIQKPLTMPDLLRRVSLLMSMPGQGAL